MCARVRLEPAASLFYMAWIGLLLGCSDGLTYAHGFAGSGDIIPRPHPHTRWQGFLSINILMGKDFNPHPYLDRVKNHRV